MYTGARLLSNSAARNLPLGSRLYPKKKKKKNSARPHELRHHSLDFITCYLSGHRQNLFLMFSASRKLRTRPLRRDGDGYVRE
jgi:hypothetical protein